MRRAKTTGYVASDSKERRIIKARYFARSMISKGQSEEEANKIAAKYYHVAERDVKYHCDEDYDDDIYFFCGSMVPIAASEIFDEGEFC